MTITTTSINLTAMRMSYHAQYERKARITNCINTLGMGDVVFVTKSIKQKMPGYVVECVTSTGLVFVVDLEKNMIITAYLGTIRHLSGLYRGAGYQRIPNHIYKMVRYNEMNYSYLI